jgi:hypothetical protein
LSLLSVASIVSVVPEKEVVTLVPPSKSIISLEATIVGPPVSPCIFHVYVPGIASISAHLLFFDKYLIPLPGVVSTAVPSSAFRDAVTVTSPEAAVVGVKLIYLLFVLNTVYNIL